VFSQIQLYEFRLARFSLTDGIFGTCFFLLTGLHAIHVIVGTILLSRCYKRIHDKKTTGEDHFFIESSIWY